VLTTRCAHSFFLTAAYLSTVVHVSYSVPPSSRSLQNLASDDSAAHHSGTDGRQPFLYRIMEGSPVIWEQSGTIGGAPANHFPYADFWTTSSIASPQK